MLDPAGEAKNEALRLDFDRRLMLRFCGSVITSDGGLLAYRELDDAVGLTGTVADVLADARTGIEQPPPTGRLAAPIGVWPARRL
jgi:hypothetical protein